MKRFAFALAGALSLVTLLAPVASEARPHGGRGGGGHHAVMHRGGGHHHGGFHHGFPRAHHGGFGWRHHDGPRFFGHPHYGWGGPRRVFVGVYGRPYPAYARPAVFGFAPGCSVRRSVGWAPGGWRKIVTVRTCYVR